MKQSSEGTYFKDNDIKVWVEACVISFKISTRLRFLVSFFEASIKVFSCSCPPPSPFFPFEYIVYPFPGICCFGDVFLLSRSSEDELTFWEMLKDRLKASRARKLLQKKAALKEEKKAAALAAGLDWHSDDANDESEVILMRIFI